MAPQSPLERIAYHAGRFSAKLEYLWDRSVDFARWLGEQIPESSGGDGFEDVDGALEDLDQQIVVEERSDQGADTLELEPDEFDIDLEDIE